MGTKDGVKHEAGALAMPVHRLHSPGMPVRPTWQSQIESKMPCGSCLPPRWRNSRNKEKAAGNAGRPSS